MKLHVAFDEKVMLDYSSRGSEPLFEIHWTHDTVAYPGAGWTDFGAVLASTWIGCVQRLWHGSRQERMLFMDGPYELHIRRMDVEEQVVVTARGEALTWHTSLTEISKELRQAAMTIADKLEELDVATRYRDGLRLQADQLGAAMGRNW